MEIEIGDLMNFKSNRNRRWLKVIVRRLVTGGMEGLTVNRQLIIRSALASYYLS